jgi:ABC-type iron transport system FetAB ATPase subunit
MSWKACFGYDSDMITPPSMRVLFTGRLILKALITAMTEHVRRTKRMIRSLVFRFIIISSVIAFVRVTHKAEKEMQHLNY